MGSDVIVLQIRHIEVKIDIGINRDGRQHLVIPLLEGDPFGDVAVQVAGVRFAHLYCALIQLLVIAEGVVPALVGQLGIGGIGDAGVHHHVEVGAQVDHIGGALGLAVIAGQQIVHGSRHQRQQDAHGVQVIDEILLNGIHNAVALRIHHFQIQRDQLAVDQLAAHLIHTWAIGLAVTVQRPARLVQQGVRCVQINGVGRQLIQAQRIPCFYHFIVFSVTAGIQVFKSCLALRDGLAAFQQMHRRVDLLAHQHILPFFDAVVAIGTQAITLAVFQRQRVPIHAPGDGLAHFLFAYRGPIAGEGQEGHAQTRIGLCARFRLLHILHHFGDCGTVHQLIDEVQFSVRKQLGHILAFHHGKDDFGDLRMRHII